MKILIWHVHGSWLTSFVEGPDDLLIPVLPDRGPDGGGRASGWDWPERAREVTPEGLREQRIDLVVLQRPHEAELLQSWTGLRAGVDVPAVYVEHNAPPGPAAATRHPLADQRDIPVVHVTHFNAVMWDSGIAPTHVIDHGIPDLGARYTGEDAQISVSVNEPVRRWRVAGTDLVVGMAERLPVAVYGMKTDLLAEQCPALVGRVQDLPQAALHARLAANRAYFHPYRWTSLGLSLLEAMTLGVPVLAFASTAAPEAVPPEAGLVSADLDTLVARARRWLADPAEARETGAAARRAALARFGLQRFLADWQTLLKEVVR